jgi:hexosaminidase
VHDSSEAPPQLETDESYVLSIPLPHSVLMPAIATLKAQTVYGALHGLESFAQLVSFDFDNEDILLS